MTACRVDPNLAKNENGLWYCKRCGCIESCECLGGMADPICDCGQLAFACVCYELEEEYLCGY